MNWLWFLTIGLGFAIFIIYLLIKSKNIKR